MRLVTIDDCNRELFYQKLGGRNSLITAETAFNMLMSLPVITIENDSSENVEKSNNEVEDYKQRLIEVFEDMAERNTLLVGERVTEYDLLSQIIGTIIRTD